MLLALDIGNTQTSIGIFERETLRYHFRFETKSTRTPEEFAASLFPLLDFYHLKRGNFTEVTLCSVVPPVDLAIEEFTRVYLNTTPFHITNQIRLPFQLNVDSPKEVGADRLANAAYAVARLALPALVVDLGTATTFDIVSNEKTYEGGAILPGVAISVEVLAAKTSKLPFVELNFPPSVIGKNTVECIQSGILFGYSDLIGGYKRRVEAALGGSVEVALTGGLSFLFRERLGFQVKHLPNLTLEGIRLLYELNHP